MSDWSFPLHMLDHLRNLEFGARDSSETEPQPRGKSNGIITFAMLFSKTIIIRKNKRKVGRKIKHSMKRGTDKIINIKRIWLLLGEELCANEAGTTPLVGRT